MAHNRQWHPEPVLLEGKRIILKELVEDDRAGILTAGIDPAIWHSTLFDGSQPGRMEQFFNDALAMQAAGTGIPLAVIDKTTGQIVGHTQLYEFSYKYRNLEIGNTWYQPAYWGTGLNDECKLLALTLAFELIGVMRVQFKAWNQNHRSCKALEKLGAVYEGTLRNHMIRENGVIRSSNYYSILDSEWPAVKARLVERVG